MSANDEDEWVEAGSPIPQIDTARVLDSRRIEVTWRSGETVIIDLTPIIANHRAFVRLREDDAFFATMRVDERGNCVFWPDGHNVAISSHWLQEQHAPQAQ